MVVILKNRSKYCTNNLNTDISNNSSGGKQMLTPRDYKVSINSDGNYEASRYNSKHKFTVTLEFLGTADSKEILHNTYEILKENFIGRIIEKSIDGEGKERYSDTSIKHEGEKKV